MIITCAHILHFVGDVMYSLENFNPVKTALSFKLWKKTSRTFSQWLCSGVFQSATQDVPSVGIPFISSVETLAAVAEYKAVVHPKMKIVYLLLYPIIVR